MKEETMENFERYWPSVQAKVCTHCIDSDGHSNCRLSGEEECALKIHFPQIVEAVLSVESDRIDPYIEALRQKICATCKHQSPDGKCTFRTKFDCGLDRYFPLVVEAIEKLRARSRGSIESSED